MRNVKAKQIRKVAASKWADMGPEQKGFWSKYFRPGGRNNPMEITKISINGFKRFYRHMKKVA